MVAHLIALRWRLTLNSWKRSTVSLVLSIIGILYVLGLIIFCAISILSVAWAGVGIESDGALSTLIGGGVVLGWILVPLLITGASPLLDPRNFLVYGIKTRDLVVGLLLSGVLTPAGILTFVFLIVLALMWVHTPMALIVGILSALLTTVLCVASMHAVAAFVSRFLASRRVREILSILILIPITLAGVIMIGLIETFEQVWDQLPQIARVLSYTPFGTLAAPWAVAEGNWLWAAAILVLTCVWLAIALAVHAVSSRNADLNTGSTQSTKDSRRSSKKTSEGMSLGPLAWADSPTTAIAGRSLIYWLKDPRYSGSLVVLPLIIVAGIFVYFFANDYAAFILGAVAMSAFITSFSISADISYDSTAVAQQITAGVSGFADRWGRILAISVWAVPFILVTLLLGLILTGDWENAAAWIGLSFSGYITMLGISSLASVLWIYPTPPPGAGPMNTPEGSYGRIMLIQLVTFGLGFLVSIPVLVLFVLALSTDLVIFQILTLLVGLTIAVIVLLVGVWMSARYYEKNQAKMFQITKLHAASA